MLGNEQEEASPLNLFTTWAQRGVRQAVYAMSTFMNAPVQCSEQTMIFIRIDDLIKFVQQKNEIPAVCLLQAVSGGVEGFFLFSAPANLITSLTSSLGNTFLKNMSLSLHEYNLEQSMIREWVNMFAGSVISSIKAPEIGIIEMTSTEQTFDMSGAALDFIACQMGVETDLIAVCHSRIQVIDSPEQMDVWIVINPSSQLFELSQTNKS